MYSVVVDCEDHCDAWQWNAGNGRSCPHGYLSGRSSEGVGGDHSDLYWIDF